MIRHVLVASIAASTLLCGAASRCEVTPQSLLGQWERVGEPAFFEQMSFELQDERRTFSSWLHDRPEIFGATWDMVGCTVTIRDAAGQVQKFRVALSSDLLTLSPPDARAPAKYRRVR